MDYYRGYKGGYWGSSLDFVLVRGTPNPTDSLMSLYTLIYCCRHPYIISGRLGDWKLIPLLGENRFSNDFRVVLHLKPLVLMVDLCLPPVS